MSKNQGVDHPIEVLGTTLVSVVIPVKNESPTLANVIGEAKRISNHTDIIVVCNGCVDGSEQVARQEGATVLSIKNELGYDVGRAVGAKHARGNIILFIDSDFILPSTQLREFCLEVLQGNDIVLNGYNGYRSKKKIHSTSQAKRLLNRLVGREDLGGSSLTAVPHALSRKALDTIGYTELAVPPKALAKALRHDITVKKFHKINVAKLNKRKNGQQGRKKRVKKLVIGDHAEAIAYWLEKKGVRSGFRDGNRRRELADPSVLKMKYRDPKNNGPPKKQKRKSSKKQKQKQRLSVIISAFNEEETIGPLLKNVKALDPLEIIVIENGSTDRTRKICKSHKVTCISYKDCLGHDVGRAIGAQAAVGDILLFLDGDMVFTAEELRPFVRACRKADLVLNNMHPYYKHSSMIDHVSMAKAFLNRTLRLSRLKYSSLTAVPHALKKKAAKRIGYHHLVVPPKAQAMAALKGLTIRHVQGPNVLTRNKLKKNNSCQGNEVEELILGDHLEAIGWAQSVLGPRLKLPDDIRRRDFID